MRVWLGVALLFIGCSSDPATPADAAVTDDVGSGSDSTPDTLSTDASDAGDASDAPTVCNDVMNVGDVVYEEKLAERYPLTNFTGGTVAPGTYVLTRWVRYSGVGGEVGTGTMGISETILVSGTTFASAPGKPPDRRNKTFKTSGTKIQLMKVCPVTGPGEGYDYKATETTIELGLDVGFSISFTYTKI